MQRSATAYLGIDFKALAAFCSSFHNRRASIASGCSPGFGDKISLTAVCQSDLRQASPTAWVGTAEVPKRCMPCSSCISSRKNLELNKRSHIVVDEALFAHNMNYMVGGFQNVRRHVSQGHCELIAGELTELYSILGKLEVSHSDALQVSLLVVRVLVLVRRSCLRAGEHLEDIENGVVV